MSQNLLNLPELTAELEFAKRVAREAATIVNTFYVGSAEVSYKADQSPVTEADRSANQHIVSRVLATYPDDGVLSEESKDDFTRLEKDRVWIIDPLDGTKEFIARNGEFSVMIGLAVQGRAVLGVVLQPESGLLYAGARGLGAYLYEAEEQIPLMVSDYSKTNRMVLVSSRSHRQQMTDKMRSTLRITSERVSGSVGLKVGLISLPAGRSLCASKSWLQGVGSMCTPCCAGCSGRTDDGLLGKPSIV